MTRKEQFSRLVMAAEPRPFWLDQPGGRQNLWLRALDTAGLGFDS